MDTRKKRIKRILLGIAVVVLAAATGLGIFVYTTIHPPLPQVEEEKEIVVCIGDSITYGFGVLMSRSRDSWPAKLQGYMAPQYQVLNLGLGARMLLNEGDLPYRAEPMFQFSKDILPDIVLIMLGTNDSKASVWNAAAFETQLTDFVQEYQNLPSRPSVYLMTPPNVFLAEDDKTGIRQNIIEEEIVGIIKQVATQTDAVLIDIFEVTKDQSTYFRDGIHPNALGCEAIARTVYDVISTQ